MDLKMLKFGIKKLQLLAFIPVNFVLKVLNKNIESLNYFNQLEHLTNNCVEGYNNMLNSTFNNKPTLFKPPHILKEKK